MWGEHMERVPCKTVMASHEVSSEGMTTNLSRRQDAAGVGYKKAILENAWVRAVRVSS